MAGIHLEIQTGNPDCNGLFVAYIDPKLDIPFADKALMTFVNGKWSRMGAGDNYRGRVHGWIGPLPAMKLEPLMDIFEAFPHEEQQ